MKKTKLNSKNPKYMKKEEEEIKYTKTLMCEAPTRNANGNITNQSRTVKIYEIKYE